MTVGELALRTQFEFSVCIDPDREIHGAYVGDLLSWVMGRAEADNAWITIMSNINVTAVAVLADVAVVILSEGVKPDADMLASAQAKGINVLLSPHTSYETAKILCGFGI